MEGQNPKLAIELDHIFILTEASAPKADLLLEMGLIEGSNNTHPGQGTSNRRFFFQNTTLEFLYVHDVPETENGPAQGLRFQERSTSHTASPFGLIMRTVTENNHIPFIAWNYCPDYFANDMCFRVGENSNLLEEPLCICMPDNFPQRKDQAAPENANWVLTQAQISIPTLSASKPLREIAQCHNIVVHLDKPHGLELTFNNGTCGKSRDFTADIPLTIHW